ncbi:Rhomboid-related protein 4 [Microtus ochrogaster]|uniref:Rhomboid-related protein 4 n=1 Tax=Microtus ochrogaster TaxID=79684 RepID=A0A8J6GLS9_MICOH|nr:Rhomboid-related protein 4 [Microtus ochrogaster]
MNEARSGVTCMLHVLTSFAGHLAGILVGLMYTQGPLKKIMETCAGVFSPNVGYPGQQYYFNSAGPSGYQNHYPDGRAGAYEETHRNYDAYTAGLSEEEQLERALRASLWDRAPRTVTVLVLEGSQMGLLRELCLVNLAVTFRKQELINDQMLLSYENMPSAALEFK